MGVKNPDLVQVEASVTDGQLTVKASSDSRIEYICADAERRVNTVVLRVPAQKYTAIECNADMAIVLLPDLGAPIKGGCETGVLAVIDEEIKSDCTMSTGNGSLLVKGSLIGGAATMEAKNGLITLEGERITGALALQTQNGSMKITADTLGKAELTTKNGSITVDTGTIAGDVTAKAQNGRLHVNLRDIPKNLALDAASGKNGKAILPTGWNANERIGSGTPTLKMSCKNGTLKLQIQ